MEKYIKDGKVGVLITEGIGGSWWTDNTHCDMWLALDKRIIEYYLQMVEEKRNPKLKREEKKMEKFLITLGYDYVYLIRFGTFNFKDDRYWNANKNRRIRRKRSYRMWL